MDRKVSAAFKRLSRPRYTHDEIVVSGNKVKKTVMVTVNAQDLALVLDALQQKDAAE